MEPLRTKPEKPVYHHPIPWQIVVALLIVGGGALSMAYLSIQLLTRFSAHEAPFWPLAVTGPALAVQVAVGLCLAARQDWARRSGAHLCWVTSVLAAIAALLGGVTDLIVPGILVCVILFFLLRSEKSAAYTYKGTRGSRPDA